jgi:hypothetical protein
MAEIFLVEQVPELSASELHSVSFCKGFIESAAGFDGYYGSLDF